MATVYWDPKAETATQASTIEVSAFDAATTYSLIVNDVTLVSVPGNTSANQTVVDMETAWNASTHPYAVGVTAGNSAANLTLTSDAAEVPFTVTPSVSGGNGTLGNFTTGTAPTGPHTVTNPDNWSGGALPAANDTIVFADSDVSALWALDELTTGNHTLVVEASYEGSIGLDRGAFERDAAGGNTTTTAPEYRPRYLQLDCARVEIGRHVGQGRPAGSARLLIDNDRAGASQTVVYQTRESGDDSTEPPVRLLAANASANVDVRSGRVGIATDAPGETSTIGNVTVSDGAVYVGTGVTLSNFQQRGGTGSVLQLGAATVTSIELYSGRLQIEGDQIVTTLDVHGGDCHHAAGANVTTANARGGNLFFEGDEARTVSTLNLYRGATVQYDDGTVTVSALTLVDDGMNAITVSAARG